MLPTSRPANYSNSEDFRLAGGRRQILTKNIKRSLPSCRCERRTVRRGCLVRFTAEARISTSRIPRSPTHRSKSPWPRRVPGGDGVRIRVRNSNQRLLDLPACPLARLPISLLSRDSRHVRRNVSAVRRNHNRVCTLQRIGERDTGG